MLSALVATPKSFSEAILSQSIHMVFFPCNFWQKTFCIRSRYAILLNCTSVFHSYEHCPTFFSLVIHSLSFRRSISGAALVVLLDDINQVLTQHLAFDSWKRLRKVRKSQGCSFRAISSCELSLNLLISFVCLKSWRKDSLFGWFANFSINFLTLSVRFLSCCSTAEKVYK